MGYEMMRKQEEMLRETLKNPVPDGNHDNALLYDDHAPPQYRRGNNSSDMET